MVKKRLPLLRISAQLSALCEVNFDSHEISEFELLKQLRNTGCKATICSNSNRYIDPRLESLHALDADAVLPKPIGGGDLEMLTKAHNFSRKPQIQ